MSVRPVLVLIGCTIGTAMGIIGLFSGTFSVFLKPIALDTGWTRSQLSLGLSLAMGTMLVVLPATGRLVDRVGPRRVVLLGVIPFSLNLAMLGLLPAYYSLFLLACAVLGVSGTLTYNVTYYCLLSRWFDRRLGLAMGIASSGAGIGLIAGPVLAQMAIATWGWRGAYCALALGSAPVLLLMALLLLRDRPAAAMAAAVARDTVELAVRTARFWKLAVVYFLAGFAINGIVVHSIPLLSDNGMSSSVAAGLAAYLGLGVLVARLASGVLLDYIDAGLLGAASFVLAAVGTALLAFPLSRGGATAAILMIGMALGAEGDVLSYIVRRLFGVRHYGAVVSRVTSCFLMGVLLGPIAAGWSFDHWGGYRPALAVFAIALITAAIVHAPLTLTRRDNQTNV